MPFSNQLTSSCRVYFNLFSSLQFLNFVACYIAAENRQKILFSSRILVIHLFLSVQICVCAHRTKAFKLACLVTRCEVVFRVSLVSTWQRQRGLSKHSNNAAICCCNRALHRFPFQTHRKIHSSIETSFWPHLTFQAGPPSTTLCI